MVIPTPAFSLYDTVTRLAGAVPVPVDTSKDGFQLTASSLEAALTPKTKVLILNSPNNPTGRRLHPGASGGHRPDHPGAGAVCTL